MEPLQVFKELQQCVLFEWARLEKTDHDLDFLGLALLPQGDRHVLL